MNHHMWPRQSLQSMCCVALCHDAGGRSRYLVSLRDGVLQLARSGLHAVCVVRSLSWRRSRSKDPVLEGLCSCSQAPLLLLLGRKNCFLILQSPLHYELILERAERPKKMKQSLVNAAQYLESFKHQLPHLASTLDRTSSRSRTKIEGMHTAVCHL